MRVLIKNGRVIDPGNLDDTLDLLIGEGRILAIGQDAGAQGSAGRVIDAAGRIVAPGLIDMHVHFRDPGEEYKETVETGGAAAVAGGFTAVCTMPNTKPVNDTAQVTRYILRKAEMARTVRVYPVAAVSIGSQGKALCEYGELKDAGAVALSDDGHPVVDSELLRRALEYAGAFGLFVISHCEDPALFARGVMNEGTIATRMGLSGIPNAAESIMVMRDIALCELTGTPVHIAHVSTRESVRAVRDAKKRGVRVTAETAPHYFTLTDAAVAHYDTNAKMNPPLRAEADRDALLEGLSDGTIDAIATDHAPQSTLDKAVEFDRAANGIVGLETALPLALRLVENGVLTLPGVIEKMAVNPGRIIGHPRRIAVGSPADLTVIDTERVFTVDAKRFRSKSRNTPFEGWTLRGKAVLTVVEGNVVFEDL